MPVASVVRQSEFQFTIVYLEENGTLWTGTYVRGKNRSWGTDSRKGGGGASCLVAKQAVEFPQVLASSH